MPYLKAVVCSLALLSVCVARAEASSILINGSFETGPAPGLFTNIAGGSTSITGWTVTGEGIDYIGSLWVAADGARSLDLDGSVASLTTPPFVHGGVAQMFATTPGLTYSVTFDLAGNVNAGPTIKPIRVLAAGQQADFQFNITGHNNVNMGWQSITWSFVANSPSTTLEFRSLTTSGSTGFGPALDNVSVTEGTAAAVPEPATLLLLGSGLIGARLRRRSGARV